MIPLRKEESSKVAGIIFPVLPRHLTRFFDEGKTVFVKFFGKEQVPRRLRPGHRLFFYQSRGSMEIVGESTIVQILSEKAEEVFTRFGDRLFLTRSEFEEYVGDRKAQRLLVLALKDVKKYAVPMRFGKNPTMAGAYMMKEMLVKLRAEQ